MKRVTLWLAIGLAFLLVGFWLRSATTPAATDSSAEPQQLAVARKPVKTNFVVSGGKRTQGPELLRLTRGDRLHLTIITDTTDELHIHGYDRHLHLDAGAAAATELLLDKAGRFEVELHKAHSTLTVIEVQPH